MSRQSASRPDADLSQTGDLENQQQRRFNAANAGSSAQNFWDIAGLNVESTLDSPSSGPTSLSFESFGPMSGSATDNKPQQARQQQQQQQQHIYGQSSRVILPPRPSKTKTGHERKRTKLSTESTPFDNVDYWIQFDNDEAAAGESSNLDLNHQKSKDTQQLPQNPSQQQQQQPQPQKPRRPKAKHHPLTSPVTVPLGRDMQKMSPREQAESLSTAAGPSSSRAPHRSIRSQELLEEDAALDYALSEEGDMTAEDFSSMNLADHMSRIDNMPPSDIPPREGLYSTPLSWEKPQPGLRPDSLMSMQNPQQLTEEEQRRLIAIAMNAGPVMGGLGSGQFGQPSSSRGYVAGGGLHAAAVGSGFNFGSGLGSLGGFGGLGGLGMGFLTDDTPFPRPETPAVAKPPQPRLSRTASTDKGDSKGKGKDKEADDEATKHKGKSGDRTAHNDIERKYRTNLKDKISELRDAVPALRTIQEGVVDEGDDNTPGNRPKVSKGTVLTKATEYISYLEKRNRAIMAQHQQLSRRLAAFEQLLSQTARPTFQMPNYSRTLFDPRAFC
ncbi:helix-loop-helix DNA-binding domain-domain-containing protein [Coniella lustricola]|uniref:Helix-loop-helix DNA-binding domain-domain-containing protein n=1 Tax=Coniella lustricola TaxID=2025994 RepID=A0A2T3AI35_9PEZI|nr:helix-loop-helix DNA-binding domain-domain-containing protein [Coniella lustricola]